MEDRKLQRAELPLLEDERGVTLVEYGVVVGLIGLACIVALTSLRGNIATLLSAIGSQVTSSN